MKVIQKVLAAILLGILSLPAFSQKMKLTEGSLAFLKGDTSINLQFSYDNMKVGKYDKEEDYVTKKKEEANSKEPGKGDSWAEKWVKNREEKFEPHFIEKFLSETKYSINKNAKYTLIFRTTFTEPGVSIGIAQKDASIDGEVWIVETVAKEKVLAKITVTKSPGRTFGGYDFDAGLRIAEAYELAGRSVGRFIMKEM